jgi:hypothetical protein
MPQTKFFLARFLVEVDVTDRPDFDEPQAADYFSSVFSLASGDKKRELKVYELRINPNFRKDVVIEVYEYRGFEITVHREAHAVGTVPIYFASVGKPNAKSGVVVREDSHIVEVVKNAAEIYVDARVSPRRNVRDRPAR